MKKVQHKLKQVKPVLRGTAKKFRYAIGNKVVMAGFFALSLTFTGVGAYQFNQPATQAASECNTNDIVHSGIHRHSDIAQHYNANSCGDFRALADHYRINPNLAPGDRVIDGQSNNRGEVIADGRVVARNAASIGRFNIQHSRQISIAGKTYYETSHVGGRAFADPNASLPTLVVLDAQGNFKFAIVKDCGNIIYAEPVPPPKPPVKDIRVCELQSGRIITIKEDQFDGNRHSKNLQDCSKIQVCELGSKKIITIRETEFDPNRHSKNLEDCKVVIVEVCELATDRIIKIDEADFDETKHSKNLQDCEKIEVCDLESNTIITIRETEFDETKHSKELKDCTLVQVCELESKNIITIRETEFDEAKHSTDLKDCETPEEIVVCDLESKQAITIKQEEFDEAKHSTDLKDCEAKCPIPGFEHLPAVSPECATPVELPKTGPASLMGAGVGFGAMGLATHYYLMSRRNF